MADVAAAGTRYSTNSGARLRTTYYDREQDVVSVAMDDLREFKASSAEEFAQFALGEFMVAGAFWLGIERAVTIDQAWKVDLLFWICAIAFLAGAVIGFFGWRQLKRRKDKIDRIIAQAEKQKAPSQESTA